MSKSTSFGRAEQEAAWKNAEVDALYQLIAADVRVPRPYGYFDRRPAHGTRRGCGREPGATPWRSQSPSRDRPGVPPLPDPAGRADAVSWTSSTATFPSSTCWSRPTVQSSSTSQVVNAAGNNAALAMLERDVNNLRPRSAALHPNCSSPSTRGKCRNCSSKANCGRRTNSGCRTRATKPSSNPDDVVLRHSTTLARKKSSVACAWSASLSPGSSGEPPASFPRRLHDELDLAYLAVGNRLQHQPSAVIDLAGHDVHTRTQQGAGIALAAGRRLKSVAAVGSSKDHESSCTM